MGYSLAGLMYLFESGGKLSLEISTVRLEQGSPTLFPESYNPIGFQSNPNLEDLIQIISWLIN